MMNVYERKTMRENAHVTRGFSCKETPLYLLSFWILFLIPRAMELCQKRVGQEENMPPMIHVSLFFLWFCRRRFCNHRGWVTFFVYSFYLDDMSLSVLFPTTHPSLTQLFSTMSWAKELTPSSLVCHAMPCHDESICLVRRPLSLVFLTVVLLLSFSVSYTFLVFISLPSHVFIWKSKEKDILCSSSRTHISLDMTFALQKRNL